MDISLQGVEFLCRFQILDCTLYVTLLKKSFTQFEASVGKLGSKGDDLFHHLDTQFGILSCQEYVPEMVLRLNVIGTQSEFSFKLFSGPLKLSLFQINNTQVKMRE